MAYPFLANPGPSCNDQLLKAVASSAQRTMATAEFVTSECVIPDAVDLSEVFDIKIVYRLRTIEERDNLSILQHFDPMYDGAFGKVYYDMLIPYICYWVWRFSEMDLNVLKGISSPSYVIAVKHGRAYMSPGQKWTWTFHGTISQLLGETPIEDGPVTVAWLLSAYNYGWHDPSDFLPYDYNPAENFFEPCDGGCELTKKIQVNLIPTPPYPLFEPDLCSISKQFVTPAESFNLKITIVNQNNKSGTYSLYCYCLGNKTTLATGSIGANQTKSETFSVTPNQLTGQPITQEQYLNFDVAISNIDGETDRLGFEIAVIITEPGTATLSGRVTDKTTGAGVVGVSVTVSGKSTATLTGGYYRLDELTPGKYNIEFVKTGYYDSTQSKTLYVGENTLDVKLTPTSEPPPSETPWGVIALGGAAAMGLTAVLVAKRKERKK
jgi:hypothetical protein